MEKYYDLWVDLSRADGCCLYTRKIMDHWDNTRLSNEELGKIVNECIDKAVDWGCYHEIQCLVNSEGRVHEIRWVANAS